MGTLGDGNGDGGAGAADSKKDDIYENRPGHKKIIRVVTVMAYMVSVSFVAIVLSAYYVFLWQPPNPRLMHRSHLRADPQVEYLVNGPPIESAEDVPDDGIDALEKVIVLGEKVSIGSQREKSLGRSKSLKVSGVDPRSKEEKIGNDWPTSTRAWNPIVRALLATTESPSVETLADSTGVYESLGAAMKSSLKTETSNSEIDGSRTRGSVSQSIARNQNGDELRGLGNRSGSIMQSGDKLYEESVDYSTIGFDNSSESTGAGVGRGVGETVRRRAKESLENSRNFTADVQPIPIATVETSGKSRPAEAQPETLGTTANYGPDFGEFMRTTANESLETVETSEKSRPAQIQPETLGTTVNSNHDFGESPRTWANESLENSTNFTPEVQPISIRTVETSGKSRPTEAQPEVLGTTANSSQDLGEPMRTTTNESLENSTNFTPEVQSISIRTVETSGKSRPAEAQPETLGTTANSLQHFGEPMRTTTNESLENSTNFTPEVQPIPIGVEETSVGTAGTSGKSRPAEAQTETLGTTVASNQQQGLNWKPLGFTVRPTKLGSAITRVETKLPINNTEPMGKFSSRLEANEDVPIEMMAGPAGDAQLASEQSASAVPAVVQPEPDYVDK